ncbi:MAG: PepSY-associated TM helix domain-containing protein [Bacteroidota bacterium]|nr:PepSY-associated TM helix domain-containing protein [Bacteroidota bacterium]
MSKKIRKWNRAIHRDLGYFFFGITIIYSLSGIALNHMQDWNPSYVVENKDFTITNLPEKENITKEFVINLLEENDIDAKYKNHYFPKSEYLKIFLKGGSLVINTSTKQANLELLKKRFFFNDANYLHYNPNIWWTYFSDIFAGALIIIAIGGLFIARGKKSITGRGAWLTAAGIIIPIIFLYFLS